MSLGQGVEYRKIFVVVLFYHVAVKCILGHVQGWGISLKNLGEQYVLLLDAAENKKKINKKKINISKLYTDFYNGQPVHMT